MIYVGTFAEGFQGNSLLNSVCLCMCVQLSLFTCCNICLQDLLLHSMQVSVRISLSGEREQRCNNWPTKECVQQIVCKGRWPFPSPDHPGCFISLSLSLSLSASDGSQLSIECLAGCSRVLLTWWKIIDADIPLTLQSSGRDTCRRRECFSLSGESDGSWHPPFLLFSRSLILSPARTKTQNLITVITDFPQPKSNAWNMVCIQSAYLFNI